MPNRLWRGFTRLSPSLSLGSCYPMASSEGIVETSSITSTGRSDKASLTVNLQKVRSHNALHVNLFSRIFYMQNSIFPLIRRKSGSLRYARVSSAWMTYINLYDETGDYCKSLSPLLFCHQVNDTLYRANYSPGEIGNGTVVGQLTHVQYQNSNDWLGPRWVRSRERPVS